MKKLLFSIEIKAPKDTVWNTLWQDATFRDSASIIDEGTYLKGEIKEGNLVEFISSVNGYGVTSLIKKLIPNEFILFFHNADTKENGKEMRESEWTGSTESYSLSEKDGITTLTVEQNTPPEQVELFSDRLPKALERIKILAEK